MKKAISAQKTKMYLEDLTAADAATGSLTNASKSAPCVAVFDDVGKLTNGVPVLVTGTGWSSLDGQTFVLQNIDAETKTATLANSDTSRETTDLNATNAHYVLHAFIDVCAVSYQINQNAAAQIDTTTLCDDEKSYLIGFTDPGTLTFDFFIDPTDPDYQALIEAQKDGLERMFEIIYRNGAMRTLPVIVQSINESGGVDQAVQGAATLKVTGASILTMPPGQMTDSYVLLPVASPASGTAPLAVTLTLNESGGHATKYSVDWKDGTPPEAVTTNVAEHTYNAAGSYQPAVVATIAGSDTAPFKSQNTVTVSAAPYSMTASVAPLTGAAPLTVTLTLSETGGAADSFEVDWGDGTSGETIPGGTLTGNHDYQALGSYTAAVTPTVGGVAQSPVSAQAVTVS
ncbi:phage tail tube protein [Paraburkholderia sp. MM5477-R1]|uniref:phage tail tube protein n=1 Tax=Paraburkholderia sp. MM5477-R1 TaxID=2991062 RepID=UPI003D210847